MRYRYVDVLRGAAALSILIWHYQHFFYPQAAVKMRPEMRTEQPFYDLLSTFYLQGGNAVMFFWALSGFVFAATYIERRSSLSDYAVNRIARLYPLHIITLVLVATLQLLSFWLVGHYQIYPINDFYHFILNVFFVQSWGFEKGNSFNAPTWSVSVEIAIYIIFFLTIPLFARARFIASVSCMAAALALHHYGAFLQRHGISNSFATCAMFFYMGVAMWTILQWSPRLALRLGLAVLAGFIFMRWGSSGVLSTTEMSLLFASLILVVGSIDVLKPIQTAAFDWFGNATYSTYLLHVPIQIAVLVVVQYLGFDQVATFLNPLAFAAFLIAVFGAGVLCYRWVEVPCKLWTKQVLGGKARALKAGPVRS